MQSARYMFNVIGKGDTFLGFGFHGELNLGVVVVQEVDSKVGLVEGGSAKVDMLLYAGESGGRTWHKLGKRDRRVATGMQQDDALEGGIKGGGDRKACYDGDGIDHSEDATVDEV